MHDVVILDNLAVHKSAKAAGRKFTSLCALRPLATKNAARYQAGFYVRAGRGFKASSGRRKEAKIGVTGLRFPIAVLTKLERRGFEEIR